MNTRMNTAALLKGIIFTKDGHAMRPSHSRKDGKLYRYYKTSKATKHGFDACDLKQIPAGYYKKFNTLFKSIQLEL